MKVDVFPGGQLGNERELIEALRMGTVEMAITSDGPVGGFFEPILVLGIPYAFPSTVTAWRVLDGSFGQELMEKYAPIDRNPLFGSYGKRLPPFHQ